VEVLHFQHDIQVRLDHWELILQVLKLGDLLSISHKLDVVLQVLRKQWVKLGQKVAHIYLVLIELLGDGFEGIGEVSEQAEEEHLFLDKGQDDLDLHLPEVVLVFQELLVHLAHHPP